MSAKFNQALPHIEAALHNSGDTHKPLHVWTMIQTKLAELHTSKNAAVVTQILQTPTGDQLHYWLAGGDLQELQELERQITKKAKKRGIKRVSLIGRAGWVKALDGYRDAGRILTKELT